MILNILAAMSPWARTLLLPALAGLVLGLLIGAFVSGADTVKISLDLDEAWSPRSVDTAGLKSAVIVSERWSRGAESPEPESLQEEELEMPDRPGLFKYLELIALQAEPSIEATFVLQNMPEEMMELMLLSADGSGLLRIEPDLEIAEGWVVRAIDRSRVVFTNQMSGEDVEYKLFEWDQ